MKALKIFKSLTYCLLYIVSDTASKPFDKNF